MFYKRQIGCPSFRAIAIVFWRFLPPGRSTITINRYVVVYRCHFTILVYECIIVTFCLLLFGTIVYRCRCPMLVYECIIVTFCLLLFGTIVYRCRCTMLVYERVIVTLCLLLLGAVVYCCRCSMLVQECIVVSFCLPHPSRTTAVNGHIAIRSILSPRGLSAL